MKTILRIMASAAVLAGFCSFAKAADNEAMPFLRITRDPVGAALAGAGRASGNTVAYSVLDGSLVSVAGSDRIGEVAASYQSWCPETAEASNFAAGAAYRISDMISLSVACAYDGYQEFGGFKPGDLLLGAGIGVDLSGSLSAGINLRYASQKLWKDISYTSLNADVLLLWRALPELRFTAGAVALGGKIKGATAEYPIPTSLMAGASWNVSFGDCGLELDADADYYLSGRFAAAAGVQFDWNRHFFARCGYRHADEGAPVPSHLALGCGLSFEGVSVDLAYLTGNDNIADTVTVGLSFKF